MRSNLIGLTWSIEDQSCVDIREVLQDKQCIKYRKTSIAHSNAWGRSISDRHSVCLTQQNQC